MFQTKCNQYGKEKSENNGILKVSPLLPKINESQPWWFLGFSAFRPDGSCSIIALPLTGHINAGELLSIKLAITMLLQEVFSPQHTPLPREIFLSLIASCICLGLSGLSHFSLYPTAFIHQGAHNRKGVREGKERLEKEECSLSSSSWSNSNWFQKRIMTNF